MSKYLSITRLGRDIPGYPDFCGGKELKGYLVRSESASVKDLSLPEEGEESPDSVGRHTI